MRFAVIGRFETQDIEKRKLRIMGKQIGNALGLLVLLTILTGFIYPLAITGLTQVLMPFQANGSLVMRAGKIVGSTLIGQNFSSPGYFHGRPSAAGQNGYDGSGSGGSNIGPTNHQLIDSVKDRAGGVRRQNGLKAEYPVPADMVTASGSGLDPDISPAAASLQVERVARARGLDVNTVYSLVDKHIYSRQFGFFGEPRINVLELNLALDALKR